MHRAPVPQPIRLALVAIIGLLVLPAVAASGSQTEPYIAGSDVCGFAACFDLTGVTASSYTITIDDAMSDAVHATYQFFDASGAKTAESDSCNSASFELGGRSAALLKVVVSVLFVDADTLETCGPGTTGTVTLIYS